MKNARAIAATQLANVIAHGQAYDPDSISHIKSVDLEQLDTRDIGLIKEICFGTLRHYFLLDTLIKPLLKKPLSRKDTDVYSLLLAGLYQLRFMRTPVHAAINSSVEACRELGKPWAKGLINAVLRNLVRQELHHLDNFANTSTASRLSHPEWLYKRLQNDWPDNLQQIIEYNNAPPPMTLRLVESLDASNYLETLAASEIEATKNPICEYAITLSKAVPPSLLPGFAEGQTSVQDAGAQLAAILLDMAPGQRVLDACAAPGGKSIHAMQSQPGIQLTALDKQPSRLAKLERDLERCQLSANVICADASNPKTWWKGELFDRVLVDAPCSGTGIISHHPDIKLLRKPKDAAQFAAQQIKLLNALWEILVPGGKLLYCTCSVLPEENSEVIKSFIEQQPEASLEKLDLPNAVDTHNGYQLLPNSGKNGGFFYARLSKSGQL